MGSELDFAKFCFHAGFGMNISCPNCFHFLLTLLNCTQGSHGLCGGQRPPCSGRQPVWGRFRPCGFHITAQKWACKEWWFQSFQFTKPTFVQNSSIQSRASNFEALAHGWRTTYSAVDILRKFSTWLNLWKGISNKRGEVSCIHLNHIGFQLLILGGAAAIQVGCSYQLGRFKCSFSQGLGHTKRGWGLDDGTSWRVFLFHFRQVFWMF